MSFRHNISVCAAMVMAVVNLSCGARMFNDGAVNRTIEVKSADQSRQCLSEVPVVLRQYFSGEGQVSDTEKVFDCLSQTIDLFSDRVRSSSVRDGYSKEELLGFIDTYVMSKKKMDPEFLNLIMRFKASLIGGQPDVVTHAELERLKQILLTLRHSAAEMRPYANWYALRPRLVSRSLPEIENFNSASERLVVLAKDLSRHFAGNPKVEISLGDVEALILKLDGSQAWLKYSGVAGAVKQVLVSPPARSIRSHEWSRIAVVSARLYSFYMRHHFYLNSSSILSVEDLPHVESMVQQSLDLFEQAIKGRESLRLQSEDWTLLIDELERVGWLPYDIRATSLKKFIWPLTGRYLRDPSLSLEARGADTGLGFSELALARSDVENWLLGHRLVVQATPRTGTLSASQLLVNLNKPEVISRAGQGKASKVLETARLETLGLLNRGLFPVWDERNRLSVIPRDEATQLDRKDLVIFNATRAIVRLVLRGYAYDRLRASQLTGLTKSETQEFYADFRDIGVDLNLMDARVYNAGERSFSEGNLFTSVSDGDEFLNRSEAIEFFSFILSGGRMSELIYDQAKGSCGRPIKDFLGKVRLDIDCMRRYFENNFSSVFSNLPGMVDHVQRLKTDSKRWNQFIRDLEDVSRSGGYGPGTIEIAELQNLGPALHYVESLMINYDLNENGVLDEPEIWKIFPVFRQYIRELGEGAAETKRIQESVFAYLIVNGRPPAQDFWGQANVVFNDLKRQIFSLRVDRSNLLTILASLTNFTREKRTAKTHEILEANRVNLESLFCEMTPSFAKVFSEHMQCPASVAEHLRAVAKKNCRSWIAPLDETDLLQAKCAFGREVDCELSRRDRNKDRSVTAPIFERRVNQTIQADPALARVCLPLI